MARTLTGIVTSDKADKTIRVNVQERKTHPIYKKQYSVSKGYQVHDEANQAKVGDKVVIVESRPISATKRWKLEKIAERAGVMFVDTDTELAAPAKEEPVS